jgi:hypothetical protein
MGGREVSELDRVTRDYQRAIEACCAPHIQKQLDMIMPEMDFRCRLEDAYQCGYMDGLKANRPTGE